MVSRLSPYKILPISRQILYACISYNIPFIFLNSPNTLSNANTSLTTPILTKPIQYPWNSSNNWWYKSWHIRATEVTPSPLHLKIILRCNNPAERSWRIERVMCMPTSANGYHGSVIWRDWFDPDSATILYARMGYVVQNEWSCFRPRRPGCVRRDGKWEVPVARKSVSGDFPWKPSLTQSTTPPFSLSFSSIKVLSLCESEKERWSEPKTAAQI